MRLSKVMLVWMATPPSSAQLPSTPFPYAVVRSSPPTLCADDPAYLDNDWTCKRWEGLPCRRGFPPVDTPERIARLVAHCPESCVDVETSDCDLRRVGDHGDARTAHGVALSLAAGDDSAYAPAEATARRRADLGQTRRSGRQLNTGVTVAYTQYATPDCSGAGASGSIPGTSSVAPSTTCKPAPGSMSTIGDYCDYTTSPPRYKYTLHPSSADCSDVVPLPIDLPADGSCAPMGPTASVQFTCPNAPVGFSSSCGAWEYGLNGIKCYYSSTLSNTFAGCRSMCQSLATGGDLLCAATQAEDAFYTLWGLKGWSYRQDPNGAEPAGGWKCASGITPEKINWLPNVSALCFRCSSSSASSSLLTVRAPTLTVIPFACPTAMEPPMEPPIL